MSEHVGGTQTHISAPGGGGGRTRRVEMASGTNNPPPLYPPPGAKKAPAEEGLRDFGSPQPRPLLWEAEPKMAVVAVAGMFTSAEVQALSNSFVTELGREGRERGGGLAREGRGRRPAPRLPRAGTAGGGSAGGFGLHHRHRPPPSPSPVGEGPEEVGRERRRPPHAAGRERRAQPFDPSATAASLPLSRASKGSRGSSLRMCASSSGALMGDASPRQPLPTSGARTESSWLSGTTAGADPL